MTGVETWVTFQRANDNLCNGDTSHPISCEKLQSYVVNQKNDGFYIFLGWKTISANWFFTTRKNDKPADLLLNIENILTGVCVYRLSYMIKISLVLSVSKLNFWVGVNGMFWLIYHTVLNFFFRIQRDSQPILRRLSYWNG